MLGHSHALTGAVTGTAVAAALNLGVTQTVTLAGFTAGMALLPDLDKCGSTPARCFGFFSEVVAWVIGKLSGGHRHATHSIYGVILFTAWAVAGGLLRGDDYGKAMLAVLIAFSVSAGLEALGLTRSHWADIIGIAAAGAVAWYGWEATTVPLGLFGWTVPVIPLAVALGASTHIAGDMLTDSGCMLLFPLSDHRFHWLPRRLRITTGKRPELLLVDPALIIGLILLAVDRTGYLSQATGGWL